MATKEGDVEVIREGLTFTRYFTTEGKHPYDDVEWEVRDAVIPNYKDGGNAFEQRDVEFPASWSQNATNIVAQKYFRGTLGTPSASRASARSSTASSTRSRGGVRRTATSPRRRRAGLRRRAEAPPRHPEGRVQLAGVVQHRRARRAAAG